MESWRALHRNVILASQSPRRRDILTKMDIPFHVELPDEIDEESYFGQGVPLEESLVLLASEKALSVAKKERESIVLGADTIVSFGDRAIGKPQSRDEAFSILKMLSGQTHSVYSGVALVVASPMYTASCCVKTDVTFRDISDDEIDHYLNTSYYMDKAGAYAIQEEALTFVKHIEGCYYNIVGFPVTAVISLLEEYQVTGGDVK